jgi:hypothetical protein
MEVSSVKVIPNLRFAIWQLKSISTKLDLDHAKMHSDYFSQHAMIMRLAYLTKSLSVLHLFS